MCRAKQCLHVCNMIICCLEGLRELDQKEWWGGHTACPGYDEPSAVFCRICTGLYQSQYILFFCQYANMLILLLCVCVGCFKFSLDTCVFHTELWLAPNQLWCSKSCSYLKEAKEICTVKLNSNGLGNFIYIEHFITCKFNVFYIEWQNIKIQALTWENRNRRQREHKNICMSQMQKVN